MPYLILYYQVSLQMEDYVLIMAPAIILASVATAFYGRLYDRVGFARSAMPALGLLLVGYGVLYFCRAATDIPTQPGNFVVQNCEISGIDRLFNLNFNKGDIWCAGRGLNDITFRNCRVEGVRRHFYAASSPDEPITVRLEDVDITAREGFGDEDFILASDFRKIELCRVTARGYDRTPVIRISSRTTSSKDKAVEITDCDEFRVERV
jgi:hypothetical protein